MQRSISLGHCVCDPQKPCPCPLFKEKNICECAGERLPVSEGPVRLTEHVRAAGCASKIGRKELAEALAGLPDIDDPRVVVGRSAGDDAGIIMLTEDTATVLTVDVFAPSVDDPYTFGQIAAANSLSDIYAMGAKAESALSIVGFPIHTLAPEVMRKILRGGIDKMAEAGVSVIGGHSINDEEIKCGFAVLGTAGAGKFMQHAGAEVGDVIILTKPLGNGITAFAAQMGWASRHEQDEIAAAMIHLNKTEGELMQKYGATAATDITGFSLLGHLANIVSKSGIEATLDFDELPLFSQVLSYAACDAFPGAVERNRESVDAALLDFGGLPERLQNILFGPETSGGLLVFLPEDKAESYIHDLRRSGNAWVKKIGSVTGSNEAGLIKISGGAGIDLDGLYAKADFRNTAADEIDDVQELSSECCCNGNNGSIDKISENGAAYETSTGGNSCCCSDGGAEKNNKNPQNASACCSGAIDPVKSVSGLVKAAAASEFGAYMAAVNNPGALDIKNKKLIALALSVSHKCEECVIINTEAAQKAGASALEISEAVALGISFGGASANMFYQTLLKRRNQPQ